MAEVIRFNGGSVEVEKVLNGYIIWIASEGIITLEASGGSGEDLSHLAVRISIPDRLITEGEPDGLPRKSLQPRPNGHNR